MGTDAVKIKQEKIDAEFEAKLRSAAIIAVNVKQEHRIEGQQTAEDGERDEKKSIPVKSSKIFLAELFKLFNAAPPEELLDDDSLLKKNSSGHKHHKKHKKEKKNKKPEHKQRIKSEGEASDTDDDESGSQHAASSSKHKHKKKKKHKRHKTEKKKLEKESSRNKERTRDNSKERARSKERSRESERERDRDRERQHSREREKKPDGASKKQQTTTVQIKEETSEEWRREWRKRKHDGNDNEREAASSKRRAPPPPTTTTTMHKIQIKLSTQQLPTVSGTEYKTNGRDRAAGDDDNGGGGGHISEISLSDEETYLKERERRRRPADGRQRSREREQRGSSGGNYRKEPIMSNLRRQRHSSRSRSRSHSLGIDKKRLLEIARKNAISMFKRGSLPGCAQMSEEVKDKVLLKMRYGGRTVQDLTEFCKKISNGENLSGLSSDEDSDVDKAGNTKAFHHPFQLREREPIVMHIRNAKPMPIVQPLLKTTEAITMQFPVSSGQQHRLTEAAWVPVVAAAEANSAAAFRDQLAPLPALPAARQSTNMFKAVAGTSSGSQRNVFGGQMPQAQQQLPAFRPLEAAATATNGSDLQDATVDLGGGSTSAVVSALPPIPAPPLLSSNSYQPVAPLPPPPRPPATILAPFVPDTAVPSANVFAQSQLAANVDVSAIISKRLNAMRRLQENPLDPEALKMMHSSQRDMTSWASSKHLPGQFTGSTGVNVLKAHELNSGPQLWARRDQMTATQPMSGGLGMQLLQKMGWKPGEGLGREGNGALTPLLLDVKLDKRGLVSKEDHRRGGGGQTMPGGHHQHLYQQHQQQQRQRANGSGGNGNCGGGNGNGGGGNGNGGGGNGNCGGGNGNGGSCAQPNTAAHVQRNMQDKHPVCLLNELTSKRKWTPPLYQLVNEVGPSHSKMFLFAVSMNGQTFTPPRASNTKKEAKFLAAQYCLQQIGILTPNVA